MPKTATASQPADTQPEAAVVIDLGGPVLTDAPATIAATVAAALAGSAAVPVTAPVTPAVEEPAVEPATESTVAASHGAAAEAYVSVEAAALSAAVTIAALAEVAPCPRPCVVVDGAEHHVVVIANGDGCVEASVLGRTFRAESRRVTLALVGRSLGEVRE